MKPTERAFIPVLPVDTSLNDVAQMFRIKWHEIHLQIESVDKIEETGNNRKVVLYFTWALHFIGDVYQT